MMFPTKTVFFFFFFYMMMNVASASFLRHREEAARPQLTCRVTAASEMVPNAVNCAPIVDGVEQSSESYQLILPAALAHQNQKAIDNGELVILMIDGASLTEDGQVHILDDALWLTPLSH